MCALVGNNENLNLTMALVEIILASSVEFVKKRNAVLFHAENWRAYVAIEKARQPRLAALVEGVRSSERAMSLRL